MGEARAREESARVAAAEAARGPSQVQLKAEQAAVLFAIKRLTSAMQEEAGQLSQSYGQREAAGEIAGAVEHLNKYAVRFLAESQRMVIIPSLVVP